MTSFGKTTVFGLHKPHFGQYGFTLVELMIAMTIGLVIILGATKVFLSIKMSYDQVQEFGNQQSALSFSVDMLARDIRRASFVSLGGLERNDSSRLYLMFEDVSGGNSKYCKGKIVEYFLKKSPGDDAEDFSLYMNSSRALRKNNEGVNCGSNGKRKTEINSDVLLGGIAANGFEVMAQPRQGYWKVRITLLNTMPGRNIENKDIVFGVMNRAAAFGKGLVDKNLSGFDAETGEKVYGRECYNGSQYKSGWCSI